MPAAWPSSLQSVLNADSFTLDIGDTAIRSDMDVGPQKVRRRSTKGIDKVSCTINMVYTLYEDLYYFYDVTTNGGVLSFDFPHPITGDPATWRFLAPPQVSPMSGGYQFRVSMQWEKLP